MRKTFYSQFVAGQTKEQVKKVIQKMINYRMYPIIEYCVEDNLNLSVLNSDSLYDVNMNKYIYSIDTLKEVSNNTNGFVAIKISSLVKPEILLKLSDYFKNIYFVRDYNRYKFFNFFLNIFLNRLNLKHHSCV
jgi:hypothetical protein